MLRAHVLTALLAVLSVPAATLAHEPGLSAVEVRVARTHLIVDLSLAAGDARSARDYEAPAGLDTFARRAIALFADGRWLETRVETVSYEAGGGVRIRLRCERPTAGRLLVRSAIPQFLPRGHRQLLSIRDEAGILIAQQMLDAKTLEASADVGTSRAAAAMSFFLLGGAHILQGYDHLLFLAALLVVVQRTSEAVKLVTAFTIAHSITLVLTVAGWVTLSSAAAELLIALSVVYVGTENLLRADVTRRWPLTFAFGLVHGLGFAGTLRDLAVGHDSTSIATSLAAFNLGVETGQVAVAAAVVPLMAYLRVRPAVAARVASVGSAVVVLAGVYWLVERAGAFQ